MTIFIDGPGVHTAIRLPDPIERECEDCGATTANRHKCEDCLVAQAIADGVLAP